MYSSELPEPAASVSGLQRQLEGTFGDYHSSIAYQKALVAALISAVAAEERARVLYVLKERAPEVAEHVVRHLPATSTSE